MGRSSATQILQQFKMNKVQIHKSRVETNMYFTLSKPQQNRIREFHLGQCWKPVLDNLFW